jgi:hypothetical protein
MIGGVFVGEYPILAVHIVQKMNSGCGVAAQFLLQDYFVNTWINQADSNLKDAVLFVVDINQVLVVKSSMI